MSPATKSLAKTILVGIAIAMCSNLLLKFLLKKTKLGSMIGLDGSETEVE